MGDRNKVAHNVVHLTCLIFPEIVIVGKGFFDYKNIHIQTHEKTRGLVFHFIDIYVIAWK